MTHSRWSPVLTNEIVVTHSRVVAYELKHSGDYVSAFERVEIRSLALLNRGDSRVDRSGRFWELGHT